MTSKNKLTFCRYGGRYRSNDTRDVYLLKCWPPEEISPIYKVGFSANVVERCYSGASPISGNFPFPVFIMCSFDTEFYRACEQYVHEKWSNNSKPMYGGNGGTEWFQFSGKLSDSDISTDFINMAMDCEKIIGNKCKLKSPNLTPSVDNISYDDSFCILGNWEYWYNNHSPSGVRRSALLWGKFNAKVLN